MSKNAAWDKNGCISPAFIPTVILWAGLAVRGARKDKGGRETASSDAMWSHLVLVPGAAGPPETMSEVLPKGWKTEATHVSVAPSIQLCLVHHKISHSYSFLSSRVLGCKNHRKSSMWTKAGISAYSLWLSLSWNCDWWVRCDQVSQWCAETMCIQC